VPERPGAALRRAGLLLHENVAQITETQEIRRRVKYMVGCLGLNYSKLPKDF
jgi:hypothetical protein